MLASLAWLRQLCPVPEDVDWVASALTSRGLTVDSVEASAEDHGLEIDVPANRPDCLGHRGLARELSAASGVPLAEPLAAPPVDGIPVGEAVRVEIEDPAECPRYTAGIVRGVRIGPSPEWVARRLITCGLRPISNVVDISNLVLLELGHPIHFFDLAKIAGGMIRIRSAGSGERLTTLDGVERSLRPGMLLIGDAERGVALAGVMGGAATEIGAETRDVLIEAAAFRPGAVRAASKELGLRSDASHRFERGVDREGALAAQHLAARLLVDLAGGTPAPGIVDAYPAPKEPASLTLRLPQLQRLLGYQPGTPEIESALAALGLAPRLAGDEVHVSVPSWRVDLEREADLVEEVARHVGYDRIPSTTEDLPPVVLGRTAQNLDQLASDFLSHRGFHEAYGYAMVAEGEDAPFLADDEPAPVKLTNPITDTLAVLRRSILPGLLRATDLNQRRGAKDIRLFEIGRVFRATGEGSYPDEPLRVGLAWSGAGQPRHWSQPDRGIDLYDMTGIVEALLGALRPGASWVRQAFSRPAWHPGHSASWSIPGGQTVAWAGALHPDFQTELPHTTFLAEIDLSLVGRIPARRPGYAALPRLSPLARDLSVVLTPAIGYADVLNCLRGVEPPAETRIEAVDSYQGPPLGADEVSVTLRVRIQPRDRSLTEEQIEEYRKALVDRLETELGITIRG